MECSPEADEGDDVEGHMEALPRADEDDDVEGHMEALPEPTAGPSLAASSSVFGQNEPGVAGLICV